jgi:carbonic anhydrase
VQHSRFAFLTGATAAFLAAPAAAAPAPNATPSPPPECRLGPVSPVDALIRLRTGNERFVLSKMQQRDQIARRRQLAGSQCPFATVVACTDSRVPPEVVFDQALGELFTCRVAGTVADTPVTGSIEYAASEFKPPPGVVVVLGHEDCGAVKAALSTLKSGLLPGASVGPLVREILPNVAADMTLEAAVQANAVAVARMLRRSPVLKPHIDNGTLRVVPAYYRLVSGRVEFLAEARGPAPRVPLAFL